MADPSRLFMPMKIGNMELKHRIGHPGLSRLRASDDHIPTDMMMEYYSQRAAVPGTLLISESNIVSHAHGGLPNTPGIWNDKQIAAWKRIVDEVHRKGCFILCQLSAMGRAVDPEVVEAEGLEPFAPSAVPAVEGGPVFPAMTLERIRQAVGDHVEAAKNAMRAGFDGVEVYAANGYLIDSFIQDVSNERADDYGGSIENRTRFAHEILSGISDAIGPERVGIRLSPWSTFQGMRMADPVPQFTHVIRAAASLKLAYIHLIESRVAGTDDGDGTDKLDFAYELWDGPILVAGGYTPNSARKAVDEYPHKDIMVMFGRYFTSNPDLVFRVREGIPFRLYDRITFYVPKASMGYLGYSYSDEYLAETTKA